MKSPEDSAGGSTPLTSNEEFARMIQNVALMRSEFLKFLIDPKRDINKECGYPDNPGIKEFKFLYDFEGVSTRVVDIFPDESWKVCPEINETEDAEETEWEKTVKKLFKKHRMWKKLRTADQISGIGRFGILLLGFNDGKKLNEAVDGIDLATGEPTKRSGAGSRTARKLVYVRAFDESVLSIKAFESDTKHPRYAQPLMYQIQMANDTGGQGQTASQPAEMQAVDVHWTRVIHIAEHKKNSIVFGEPRLRRVFNRCWDLRKILGGSGEMFWKGGFPGLAFESQPGTQNFTWTDDDKKKMREEYDKYQNGLQRYLALVGMQAKSLAPQVADPQAHVETNVKMICASWGIPYRIFLGSEEAQLAGEQDKKSWNERLAGRQNDYLTPEIIDPLIERLMAVGVIEYKEDVTVNWPDMNAPTQKEKAETAKNVTDACAKYIQGQVDIMIPPLEFMTYVLGYDNTTAQKILESANLALDGTLDRGDADGTEVDELGNPIDPNNSQQRGTQTAQKPAKKTTTKKTATTRR